MAALVEAPSSSPPTSTMSPAVGRLYRLNVEQYCRMAETGVLAEGTPVILWDGLLVEKMTKYRPHTIALSSLHTLLVRSVPEGWHVTQEGPISIDDDKVPEPDLTVVRGASRDYPRLPPTGHDVALVIEVAESSLSKDLGPMLVAYASQSIPVYWVVNLVAGRVEVYTQPTGPADPATYRARQDFGPDDIVPIELDGREVGRIAVRDVLP